jgi:hypothetical protein
MRKSLLMLFGVVLFGTTFSQSIEPSVIGSMGDYYSNSIAQLSFTVGEVMIETVSSTNNIITQGFQQPEQNNVGITESSPKNLSLKFYPNPTKDILSIEFEGVEQGMSFHLFDMNGKMISTQTLESTENKTQMSLKDYVDGTYLLYVISDDQQYKATYKVQKVR